MFNPYATARTEAQRASIKRSTARASRTTPKRISEMMKPSKAVVTKYDPSSPDAPRVDIVRTGHQVAPHLWD